MWQLEDTLRAYGCDAERLRDEYVARFDYNEKDRAAEAQWLGDLCQMLLQSPKHPFYSAAYYKALPFIVEFRSRSGHTDAPELENCFEALYGTMLLRLQQKAISKETQEAVTHISHLLALLADAWRKERAGELDL